MHETTPSPHPELDQLAFQLFHLVSRFEYALKAAGYRVREEGRAEPNWDRFARDAGAAMLALDHPEYRQALGYLLAYPPKKQMVRNGSLNWEDSMPEVQPKARLILTHVRQVRNNLFHGGKFNAQWHDPQRSQALMDASLTVLRQVVNLQPAVRDAFDGH